MPSSQQKYDAKSEQALMAELWRPEIADDPRAFVRFAFPWGKAGTPLEHLEGPRNWQDKVLLEMAKYIKGAKTYQQIHGHAPDMFHKGIASGRGVGKSALYGWIACWLVSTRLGSSVWVAANGEPQLRTKTFPEISKWFTMAINSHWFDPMATKIVPAPWLSSLVQDQMKIDPQYWYVSAQLWSEENPDAFAGAHNVYGECALFDEASGIPKALWTVQQGVFTEDIVDRYWFAFSNPRRNDGAFFECFHKNKNLWRPTQINALDVEGLAKDPYLAIIAEHGADSDQAKIEVYGQFPEQDEHQYISKPMALEAASREVFIDRGAPLVMGVDVARKGSDYCVIAFRQGRDARSIPWIRFKSDDNVKTATLVADAAQKYKVDAIFIDGNGIGSGVVDVLKAWHYKPIEVQAGEKAKEENKYALIRDEGWGRMREWLATAAIPNDETLITDLVTPWHTYHPTRGVLVMESKEHMREKRGLSSPDMADALALTFYCSIARKDSNISRSSGRQPRMARDLDYPIFR